jgi:hypothetical protein
MKAVLVATLISIALIGTPLALVSTPATYACGPDCSDETDDFDVTEAVPGWADCDINFDCMRLL